MSPSSPDSTEPGQPTIYRIRVTGHLPSRWEGWFAPLTVAPQPNGETLLVGPVTDQSALHGVLKRIRDLGLPLVSIERSERGTPPSSTERSTT